MSNNQISMCVLTLVPTCNVSYPFARLEKVAIHSHRGKAKVLGTCVAVAGAMLMTFWRGQVIPLPWNSLLHAKKIHRHDEDILRGGLMLVCSCLSWSFYVILQVKSPKVTMFLYRNLLSWLAF